MDVSRRKSTITNVVFGYAQFGVSLVTGILLVPFYLDYISVSVFGAWIAINGLVTWFSIVDPGTANVFLQRVASALGEGNGDDVGSLFNVAIVMALTIGMLILALGFGFRDDLIAWLRVGDQGVQIVVAFELIVVSASLMVVVHTLIAFNLAMQNAFAVGIINLSSAVIKIFVVVILLFEGNGVLSLAYAELSAAIWLISLSFLVLVSRFRKFRVPFCRKFSGGREILALSILNYGARFSKIVTRSLDSVLISRSLGAGSVAEFSLSMRGPQLAAQLASQPIAAIRPALSHVNGSDHDGAQVKQICLRCVRMVMWASVMLLTGSIVLNLSFVGLWVGEDLFIGEFEAVLLSVVVMLRLWTTSIGMIGFSLGAIAPNSKIDVLTAVVLLPLSVYGLTEYGVAGLLAFQIAGYCLTAAWMLPVSLVRVARLNITDFGGFAIEAVASLFASLVCFVVFADQVASGWLVLIVDSALLVLLFCSVLLLTSAAARNEALAAARLARSVIFR